MLSVPIKDYSAVLTQKFKSVSVLRYEYVWQMCSNWKGNITSKSAVFHQWSVIFIMKILCRFTEISVKALVHFSNIPKWDSCENKIIPVHVALKFIFQSHCMIIYKGARLQTFIEYTNRQWYFWAAEYGVPLTFTNWHWEQDEITVVLGCWHTKHRHLRFYCPVLKKICWTILLNKRFKKIFFFQDCFRVDGYSQLSRCIFWVGGWQKRQLF